jgi:glucose dehydrogenase
MLPLFPSKPVFSAFLFIVVGVTMAGGGMWLLFLDGSCFYLFAGSGILLTGIMLLSAASMAPWFYGVVLIATMALAVHEMGFSDGELESQLLAPAILGVYLLVPAVAQRLARRPIARRQEPAFQLRLAVLAPALGVVGAIAVAILSVLNSADVSDAATSARRIANVRGVDGQRSALGSPRSANMMSSLNPRLYWRDERTDYP